MDNTGRSPLRVPGFGIPLDYELPAEEAFAHGLAAWRPRTSDRNRRLTGWRQVPTVTEHELAMVRAINMITDLPNWSTKISENPEALPMWREFVRAEYPQLTDRAWEWCVQELRDKATDFSTKGFVAVLDTGSVVCKSDVLLQPDLVAGLADSTQKHFKRAKTQFTSFSLAPHEVNAVDPHMYPLVYGRSRVLQKGGSTSLDHPFGIQHAELAPIHSTEEAKIERDVAMRLIQSGMTRYKSWSTHPGNSIDLFRGKPSDSRFLWSPHFQSLPCEVETGDGDGEVRITSYINNLHPIHDRKVYHYVEKLMALSMESWNSCLIKGSAENPRMSCSGRPQKGRVPARIPTMGRTWINELPLMALAFRTNERPKEPADYLPEGWPQEIPKIPSTPTAEAWAWAEWYHTLPETQADKDFQIACTTASDAWRSNVWQSIAEKAVRRCDQLSKDASVMPEPAMTLSYDEWKSGQYSDPLRSTVFIHPHKSYQSNRGRSRSPRGAVERRSE